MAESAAAAPTAEGFKVANVIFFLKRSILRFL